MPSSVESMTTHQLLLIIQAGDAIGHAEAAAELLDREILENDDDDSAQHRGGVRPGHAPILP